MPEFEFPGVVVEEAGGKPKPVDGVPTDAGDAPTWADGPHVFCVIAIGGVLLAGLGISLAMIRGDVIMELLRMSGGIAGLVALVVSAFVLSLLRALVEWRRRKAGRPPLRPGRLALGAAVFLLANFVATAICLLALLVSLAVGPAFTSVLLAAFINVVVGGAFIWLAGAALRDLLLLVQAARNGP